MTKVNNVHPHTYIAVYINFQTPKKFTLENDDSGMVKTSWFYPKLISFHNLCIGIHPLDKFVG